MICGNGLIAQAFASTFDGKYGYSIFASGVSNSREVNVSSFLREKKALTNFIERGHCPIYFSTCSIYDPILLKSPYVQHKLEMEAICSYAESFLIFRLPQVVGKTDNPNTITNFLFNKIRVGSNFELWKNASRVLIDVDDVVSIVNYMIKSMSIHNKVINIAHDFPITVLRIVEIFESIMRVKANYNLIDTGCVYNFDSTAAFKVAQKIGINFDDNYSEKLLYKYYAN